MAITIPSGIFDLYHEGVDALIDAVGKTCVLVYPSLSQECPNCILNTFTNTSANVYKTGGPQSFSFGVCPYCNGDGFVTVEQTDELKLIVHALVYKRDLKQYDSVGFGVQIPDGSVIVKGYFNDVPKLQRAIELRVDKTLFGVQIYRYERLGEIVPIGFKNRYCLSLWGRIT